MKGKITIWRFVGVLSLLVVAFGFICVFNGCEFVKSQMDAYCDIEDMLPDTLKINLPPNQLSNADSVSMENVFNYVKNSDKMVRDIYKSNAQSSAGTNQLRLFIKNPWQRTYWEIWFCVGVCFVFLFLLRAIVKYSWFKPLLFLLFVATALVLAMLNLSSGLKTSTINDIDRFFISVFFFNIGLFLVAFLNMFVLLMSKNIVSDIRIVREEHRRKTLLWAAVVGWTLAYVIFFVGMYASGTQKSALTAIIRPAFSASKMFFMADSPSDLAAGLRQNGAFMGFYSLVKIYVLVITTIMLLSLVLNRWKTFFETKMENARNKQLFVFFGINRASVVMAKNIKKEVSEDKRVLLFVENRKENADLFKSLSFSSILGLFKHRPEAYETVDDLGARLIISNVMMSSPGCSDLIRRMKKEKVSYDDIKSSLGLKRFFCLVEQAQNVHCFFLYDDEQININGANNLRLLINNVYKEDVKSADNAPIKINIHCWARKDGRTQMLEIPNGIDRTEIKILDSSLLSVQSLMRQSTYHPVQFVDVDTSTASVTSRFEALIIGFGETGQDALKFLYEFGAFLHHDCATNPETDESDASTLKTYRSSFHCDVIDGQMTTLKPTFLSQAPAIKDAYNMKKTCSDIWLADRNDPLVSFHQARVGDESYIALVERVVKTVNYIVIALGNDELNIAALNALLPAVVKVRMKKMDKFKIFVRNYCNAYNDVLSNIVNYYNELFSSQKPIILFGQESSLFSYKLVVGEELIKNAEIFYEHYRDLKKDSSDKPWAVRHQEAKGFKYDDKKDEYKPIPLSWSIRPSIKRKEQQDINNYLHIDTKLRLIIDSKTKHDKRIYQELYDGLVFNNSGRKYVIENKKYSNIYTNLARTEKLRWNASHEMLGYLPNEGTGCNELDKTHNCLINWCNLPEATERYNREAQKKGWSLVDYQAYDYLVVKTTFELELYRQRETQQIKKEKGQKCICIKRFKQIIS